MKVSREDSQGFRPFTITVTVETQEEARVLQALYTESYALGEKLSELSMISIDHSTADKVMDAIGYEANRELSK
ncbi:hypothetical protein [Burkholderia cepacia]|uniref:hypothetical protein n=1 Tax=Burkholderia cepacia TaxID=292 RepID=UPI001CF53C15|nr:hypothetical protein [Burkholderia cepacia]MCA8110283.1 hypothetical protein [Burkholderia cepacia]MCA8396582.1 hypothetical protein [Burkholderia cepacia]